jgi:hypothetical protein
MAANIEPVRIAAEFRRVFIDPRNPSAHLIRHHTKIAVRCLDGDEVKRHVVCAGIHEQLGWKGIIFRLAAEPSAAMNEDEDRSIRPLGAIDVELFYSLGP